MTSKLYEVMDVLSVVQSYGMVDDLIKNYNYNRSYEKDVFTIKSIADFNASSFRRFVRMLNAIGLDEIGIRSGQCDPDTIRRMYEDGWLLTSAGKDIMTFKKDESASVDNEKEDLSDIDKDFQLLADSDEVPF